MAKYVIGLISPNERIYGPNDEEGNVVFMEPFTNIREARSYLSFRKRLLGSRAGPTAIYKLMQIYPPTTGDDEGG